MDAPTASPTGPLRVAWFGHAGGKRADGLSTYSLAVTNALSNRGVRVRFFFHRHDGTYSPISQSVPLTAAKFKTVIMPAPGTASRIASALREFRPDVVHVSLSFSLLDTWLLDHARRSGIPTVATVHLPYAPVKTARGRVLQAVYRLHASTLTRADRCIALSNDQRDLLVAVGCAPGRIDVVPNGVDVRQLTPGASRIRSALGARFVVAYMGRLDPEKRVPALARAFQEQSWPADHRLLIAGSGTQEARIARMSAADPRIVYLGAVHDRRRCLDILRAADVFVLPSTAEGLSLAMLEAMATGCAVVATEVGEDGAALEGAGMLIPVRPLQPALGTALQLLRDDAALRADLGRRARERVEDAYSLERSIDRLMTIYGDVCHWGSAVA